MITLDLTPAEETQIETIARQIGLAPDEYVKQLVKEHLPSAVPDTRPVIDDENAAAIALLDSWIAKLPTDPEEIRKAEADRNEFYESLNRNRIESGERPLFP